MNVNDNSCFEFDFKNLVSLIISLYVTIRYGLGYFARNYESVVGEVELSLSFVVGIFDDEVLADGKFLPIQHFNVFILLFFGFGEFEVVVERLVEREVVGLEFFVSGHEVQDA